MYLFVSNKHSSETLPSSVYGIGNSCKVRWPKWLTFHIPYTSQFRILNFEICTTNFGIRNCEVYVMWTSGKR